MADAKVTIQTEEERTISLCDYCGVGDDKGELVEYTTEAKNRPDFHYHIQCLQNASLDDSVEVYDTVDVQTSDIWFAFTAKEMAWTVVTMFVFAGSAVEFFYSQN